MAGAAQRGFVGQAVRRRLRQCAAALLATAAGLAATAAHAQLTVQISGAGANQYPIASPSFRISEAPQ